MAGRKLEIGIALSIRAIQTLTETTSNRHVFAILNYAWESGIRGANGVRVLGHVETAARRKENEFAGENLREEHASAVRSKKETVPHYRHALEYGEIGANGPSVR